MALVAAAQGCVYALADCLAERPSADLVKACGHTAWGASCRVQLDEGMNPTLAPTVVICAQLAWWPAWCKAAAAIKTFAWLGTPRKSIGHNPSCQPQAAAAQPTGVCAPL